MPTNLMNFPRRNDTFRATTLSPVLQLGTFISIIFFTDKEGMKTLRAEYSSYSFEWRGARSTNNIIKINVLPFYHDYVVRIAKYICRGIIKLLRVVELSNSLFCTPLTYIIFFFI